VVSEVDEVTWDLLGHAYGQAKDTPGLLKALDSPDVDAAEKALAALYSSICHQGSVYTASVAATPILFGIAGRLADRRRQCQVVLLAINMADAYAEGVESGYPAADACKDIIRALVAGRIPRLIALDDGSRSWLLVLASVANSFPDRAGALENRFRAALDTADEQLRVGLLGLLYRMGASSHSERDEFVASEIYRFYEQEAVDEKLPEAFVTWNATGVMLSRGLKDAY
jgi:hypothetical protein